VLGYGSALLSDAASNDAGAQSRGTAQARGAHGGSIAGGADTASPWPASRAKGQMPRRSGGRTSARRSSVRASPPTSSPAFRNFPERGNSVRFRPRTSRRTRRSKRSGGRRHRGARAPGRLEDTSIIDELAPHGLRGLEAFYPRHDAAEVRYFREKAAELGLMVTGGADFHDIRYHTQGVGIDVPTRRSRRSSKRPSPLSPPPSAPRSAPTPSRTPSAGRWLRVRAPTGARLAPRSFRDRA